MANVTYGWLADPAGQAGQAGRQAGRPGRQAGRQAGLCAQCALLTPCLSRDYASVVALAPCYLYVLLFFKILNINQ